MASTFGKKKNMKISLVVWKFISTGSLSQSCYIGNKSNKDKSKLSRLKKFLMSHSHFPLVLNGRTLILTMKRKSLKSAISWKTIMLMMQMVTSKLLTPQQNSDGLCRHLLIWKNSIFSLETQRTKRSWQCALLTAKNLSSMDKPWKCLKVTSCVYTQNLGVRDLHKYCCKRIWEDSVKWDTNIKFTPQAQQCQPHLWPLTTWIGS